MARAWKMVVTKGFTWSVGFCDGLLRIFSEKFPEGRHEGTGAGENDAPVVLMWGEEEDDKSVVPPCPAELTAGFPPLPWQWGWSILPSMEITLPTPLDERISPRSAALHLAIGLFVTEEATLGQAAQTAGLTQAEFLRELGRRRIPIHYGKDELEEDLKAVEALEAR